MTSIPKVVVLPETPGDERSNGDRWHCGIASKADHWVQLVETVGMVVSLSFLDVWLARKLEKHTVTNTSIPMVTGGIVKSLFDSINGTSSSRRSRWGSHYRQRTCRWREKCGNVGYLFHHDKNTETNLKKERKKWWDFGRFHWQNAR